MSVVNVVLILVKDFEKVSVLLLLLLLVWVRFEVILSVNVLFVIFKVIVRFLVFMFGLLIDSLEKSVFVFLFRVRLFDIMLVLIV